MCMCSTDKFICWCRASEEMKERGKESNQSFSINSLIQRRRHIRCKQKLKQSLALHTLSYVVIAAATSSCWFHFGQEIDHKTFVVNLPLSIFDQKKAIIQRATLIPQLQPFAFNSRTHFHSSNPLEVGWIAYSPQSIWLNRVFVFMCCTTRRRQTYCCLQPHDTMAYRVERQWNLMRCQSLLEISLDSVWLEMILGNLIWWWRHQHKTKISFIFRDAACSL